MDELDKWVFTESLRLIYLLHTILVVVCVMSLSRAWLIYVEWKLQRFIEQDFEDGSEQVISYLFSESDHIA